MRTLQMKLRVIFVFFVFLLNLAVPFKVAEATNGSKFLGNGPTIPSMGGVGVANPQDTGGIFINPASVATIEPRIDQSLEIYIAELKLDSSAAPGTFFGNSFGTHKSEGEIFISPGFGFSNRYEDSNFYYGLGFGVVSGLKADFKHSRISTAVSGNLYDKHIESAMIELVPAFAYRFDEKLSVGISPVLGFEYLIGNLANGAFGQTGGADKYSYAWGAGFNVGFIYDASDKVSLGVSYKSHRWFQGMDDYGDLANRIDGAPEYIFGASYQATPKWFVETDVKWIQWTDVDILNRGPVQGGFGWKDQWVFGIGTQYDLGERAHLRMGYNYGKSPIRPHVIYANALTPLITEHHLGLGFGYDITEKLEVNAGWTHAFKRSEADDGTGDAYSIGGKGTRAILSIDSFTLGISYKFG